MNTLANQVPQYINIQGNKLAVVPAEHYEELVKKVQKVEFYEEDDFYYELSQEDLEEIKMSEKEFEMGLEISHEEVMQRIKNRRLKK